MTYSAVIGVAHAGQMRRDFTAYIERPHEFGVAQPKNVSPQPGNDLHAQDLNDLASMLGC